MRIFVVGRTKNMVSCLFREIIVIDVSLPKSMMVQKKLLEGPTNKCLKTCCVVP